MPQVLRELRYDEGLTQDWSWKGLAECQRRRSVLQPPSCFCITSPWIVTQFKITVGIRAQFLNGMLAANAQFCQSTTKAITQPARGSGSHSADPFALAFLSSGMHTGRNDFFCSYFQACLYDDE